MPTHCTFFDDAKKDVQTPHLEEYIVQIEKGFPTTPQPTIIPTIQDKIVNWHIGGQGYNLIGVSLGQDGVQYAHDDCLDYMKVVVKHLEEKHNYAPITLPNNVLTISCTIGTSWRVGNSCQEFLPNHIELKEDGFFTYRMMSQHVQATLYNIDGVEYLAGICYYVQPLDSTHITVCTDHCVLNNTLATSEPYPPTNRYEEAHWKDFGQYGRFCKTAGMRVCVSWPEKEEPRHTRISLRGAVFRHKFCEECRKDAENYKWNGNASTPTPDPIIAPIAEKLEELKVDGVKMEDPVLSSDDDFELVDYTSE